MVKELNNMKNKKSNSYKPYDSSNSFVRRVTSRVSQLLPQPTSWLSRFLSRPPENAEPVESPGAEEEAASPPPSKRMRTVQTCTEFPLYHNSIGPSDHRRLEERREEELSPIRSYKFPVSGPSRSDDIDAPGPSGLSRHHHFVASTPAVPPSAVPQPQHIQPKINGDDGSDSDSASHASSIPPEAGDRESQSLFRGLSKSVRPRRYADEHGSNLLRSKQLKLDLSNSSLSSSRGRVSFDTTVFNSPFKGRLCGGLSMSRDDSIESPFYRSNTTFGGASSCNDSMLRTRSLHSEVPIVVQPSKPQRVSDNLGSSTKKILKALEQFSTPMLDQSRRTPARDRGLKRKVEVPFKELVIPQMPDLLRIKRRDARLARQSAYASTSVSKQVPSVPTPVPASSKHTNEFQEAVIPMPSTSQLPLRLDKFDKNSVADETEVSMDRKDNKKPKESPTLIKGLPLTTLPKFDTGLVKPPPALTNLAPTKAFSNQFKFSKPKCVNHGITSLSSIPPSKKFSKPLNPEVKVCVAEKGPTENCVGSFKSHGVEMTYTPPTITKLKRKEPVCESKSVFSAPTKLKSGSVSEVFNKPAASVASELKSGSVLDALKSMEKPEKKADSGAKWECQECYVRNDESKVKCVACEQPRKIKQAIKDVSKGFGDKFKMSSNQWECSTCLVRNNMNNSKCLSCGETKPGTKPKESSAEFVKPLQPSIGFGDKFKPSAGSWKCAQCLVQNKNGDTKCVSCSSDKPGAETPASSVKTTAVPLSNLFKKPEGSWECDTCLVRNKSEVTSCVACGTCRPGTESAQPASSTPQFSFGIPATSEPDSKFTFGISNSSSTESGKPTQSIVSSSTVPSTQTTTPIFTFGIPSAPETKSPTPTSAPSLFNKSADKKEESVDSSKLESNKSSNSLVQKSEPSFTFGIPANKESIASPPKSLFGGVVSVPSSTPATSAPVFIFSNTANTNATPSGLPIFVNQISSTKPPVTSVEKSTAPVTNPIFTFGLSSSSIGSLGKSAPSEAAKPVLPSLSDCKPMITSPVNKVNTTIATMNPEITPETKPSTFTFSSSMPKEEKPFLNSKGNESSMLVFNNASTPNESSNVFNSPTTVNSFNAPTSSAPIKPVFAFSGDFSTNSDNNQKPSTVVNSFSPQLKSDGFSFKSSESNFPFNQKKPDPPAAAPFQFNSSSTNHTNSFGTSTPAVNQFNSGFNNATSTPFNAQDSIFGSSAPQPVQTASFLFGASQANDRPPPAPTFNFTAQTSNPAGNNVGNTSVAGGFAFGQNSAPVQPPAFDPNIKPVFNFSGGQTPTFSATAAPGNAVATERKFRKAIRRTTQK